VTNVQDHAVISTVASLESGFPAKVEIGNHVTIGKAGRRMEGRKEGRRPEPAIQVSPTPHHSIQPT